MTSPLASTPGAFVGRVDELARLGRLVASERLVTLWGPGGIGKTRLAHAFVAMRSEASAPTVSVTLGGAEDEDALLAAVARALGLRLGQLESPAASSARIGRRLAEHGPLLLVLDDLDLIVEPAAAAISAWLAAAPSCHVLATSRELLALPSEHALELGPLGLPAEAAELFLARVRQVVPEFAAEGARRVVLERLVHGLDGIPLAIELAAARCDLLGLDALAERVASDQRLAVLAPHTRGRAGRQATLRAAIASSWELLAPAEQTVLAALATLPGDFSVAAAEAVVGVPDALGHLQSLRAKSLLTGTREPSRRFTLYAAVAEFAREELARWPAEERAALAARHARWLTTLAADAVARVRQRGEEAAIATLAAERASAMAVAREGSAADALAAAAALEIVAVTHGPYAPYARALDATLARADAQAPSCARAEALRARGRLAFLAGELDVARGHLETALALARQLGADAIVADASVDLGVLLHQQRALSEAAALYSAALAAYRARGELRLEGRVLGNLAALAHDARRLDEALARYADALALLLQVGDDRLAGILLTNRALASVELDHPEDAWVDFTAARECLERVHDPRLSAIALTNLGALLQRVGRHDEARGHHLRARGLLREVGDVRSEALCSTRLAAAHAALGDRPAALAALTDAELGAARQGDVLARETVALGRAFLDLGEPGGTERIRARITGARIPRREGSPALVDLSDDARMLVVLLEELSGPRIAPLDAPLEVPRALVLELDPDGHFLRDPEGRMHDFRRRRALRLILLGLVAQHRASPGRGLAAQAVLEAGWPGERPSSESGANRVYVAMTTLRGLGLKDALVRHDDGYLLKPETRVVVRQPRAGA